MANQISIKLTEAQLSSMIKDFLSLSDGGIWNWRSPSSNLNLKFQGNIHRVQNEIYNWLDLPQRKIMFKGE